MQYELSKRRWILTNWQSVKSQKNFGSSVILLWQRQIVIYFQTLSLRECQYNPLHTATHNMSPACATAASCCCRFTVHEKASEIPDLREQQHAGWGWRSLSPGYGAFTGCRATRRSADMEGSCNCDGYAVAGSRQEVVSFFLNVWLYLLLWLLHHTLVIILYTLLLLVDSRIGKEANISPS